MSWRRRAFSVAVAVLASAILLLVLNTGEARAAYPLVDVFVIAPGGDCTAVACTSASRVLCRNSSTDPTIFVCDPATQFFRASTGTDLVGDPVVVTGSLAVNTGGGAAGSLTLQESAPGTFTGKLTPGDLTANRVYTQPDLTGTVALLEGAVTYTGLKTFSNGVLVPAGGAQIGGLLVLTGDPSAGGTLTVNEGGFDVIGNSNLAGNLNVDTGDVAVDSGRKVCLDGAGCTSHLLRDTATGRILVYRDGVLKAAITENGVLAGLCGPDLWKAEPGTSCTDAQGRAIVVGAAGPVVVTGGLP